MQRNFCSAFFIAAISGCLMTFYSCNDVCSCKKESCPGYSNADFDSWFPYQTTGEQLVFADSSGLTKNDTIILTNVSESGSYEAQRGCYNSESGCTESKDVYSERFTLHVSNFTDWDGTTTVDNYSLSLDTFKVESNSFGVNGFIGPNAPSLFSPSVSVGGKYYQNVQVISNADTANATNILYQIFLQKGIGLLAYRYYPSGSLFVKKP